MKKDLTAKVIERCNQKNYTSTRIFAYDECSYRG